MSLYRRWRPKSFAELVGQDAVVRTLSTALSTGKLAHAYLFSGPRGSGKTSAAKILARCIDCVRGPTPEPDNSCENCRAIIAGTALDVLEIDAASNRGIDEIRALRESVKFAPSAMRSKVYIVDEAHMLTREGANAFLKTLEEPPAHAVFILATTAPEALPPTILSRCQRYAFRRIAVPVMIERMRTIARAEEIEIDDGALAAIAYRADGGLRDALTMLEQSAAFAEGPIDVPTVDAAFGTTGRDSARMLSAAALGGDAPGVLRVIDEASDSGTDMQTLIRSTVAEFRHVLVARIDPDLLARELSADDVAAVRSRAADVPQAKLVRGIRLLTEALTAARASGHPRLELESAMLRFTLAGEDPSLDALAVRIAALEGGAKPASAAGAPRETARRAAPAASISVAPAPAPEPLPSRAPPAASGGLTFQKVRSLWQSVRDRIEASHAPLRGPLSRAMLESFEDGTLTIKTEKLWAEILRKHLPLIQTSLADVLGVPVAVELSIDTGRRPTAGEFGAADGPESSLELMQYAEKKLGGAQTR